MVLMFRQTVIFCKVFARSVIFYGSETRAIDAPKEKNSENDLGCAGNGEVDGRGINWTELITVNDSVIKKIVESTKVSRLI